MLPDGHGQKKGSPVDEQEQQMIRDLIGRAAQEPGFYAGALSAMEQGLSEYLSSQGFDLSPQQVSQLVRMDHSNVEEALNNLDGGKIGAA